MPVRRLIHDNLLRSAASVPTKPLVVADDAALTHAELLDAALRLAGGFAEAGVHSGDRILLFMENTSACATAVFGTWLCGGVIVPVNAQTTAEKLAQIVDDCTPTVLVAEGSLARVAADALALTRTRPLLVDAAADAPFGAGSFAELLACDAVSPPPTIPVDLAALVYTSGTTGVPKGVMLTHESIQFAVESIVEYLRLGADERILSVLQTAFTYGLSQLLIAARLGGTLHLERSFAYPARTLDRLAAVEATIVPAVPTVWATIVSAVRGRTTFPSVRVLTNAAAGLPPALHEPLAEVFPNALLFRMYGQTECIRVCYLEPERVAAKPTSVGRAMPGTDAVVLDADARPVRPGEVGILHVRGPNVMVGYWNAPELTALALRPGLHPGDRMLATNDLFTVDEEGDLYFVARNDEVIKTRGEKVSPAEVDAVLFAVDGVREAAVVGVPDDTLGEAIDAYVVLDDGAELTEREILRVCRQRLPLFAVPQRVTFVPDLPKTPSGKVRRRSLADYVAASA